MKSLCVLLIQAKRGGYLNITRGRLNVRAGPLVYEVEDTGMGIREEDQPKLFSAFEQADKSKNRSIVGTGLGFSISKSFVEMMGGSISFKSIYGQGSVFTVTVPIIPGNMDRIQEKIAISEIRTIHAPGAKVLVVDDIAFNLKVVCGLLKMINGHNYGGVG